MLDEVDEHVVAIGGRPVDRIEARPRTSWQDDISDKPRRVAYHESLWLLFISTLYRYKLTFSEHWGSNHAELF